MDAGQVERIANALEGLDRRHGAPQGRESYIREAERFAVALAAMAAINPPASVGAVKLNRPRNMVTGRN